MRPFSLALVSAASLHAAAASLVALGVSPAAATPARAVARVPIELEQDPAALPAPPPIAHARSTRPSRGVRSLPRASAPVAAPASPLQAPAPEVVAAPSAPTAPEPARFTMTVSGAPPSPAGGGDVPASAAAPEVVAEADVTTRARRVGGVDPAYPPDAAAQGVELTSPLAFEIVVDPTGRVTSARELGHAGYGFDEAAAAALRAFRFSPATRAGRAVWVRMRWTVEFRLE